MRGTCHGHSMMKQALKVGHFTLMGHIDSFRVCHCNKLFTLICCLSSSRQCSSPPPSQLPALSQAIPCSNALADFIDRRYKSTSNFLVRKPFSHLCRCLRMADAAAQQNMSVLYFGEACTESADMPSVLAFLASERLQQTQSVFAQTQVAHQLVQSASTQQRRFEHFMRPPRPPDW